jgi:hypothetical protein
VLRRAGEIRRERRREALALLEAGVDVLPEFPPHLRGIPILEALLERSWSFRFESPGEMVRYASWAQLIAEKLEPCGLLAAAEIADLRCRAWIELGNAYRVADDLAAAQCALARAVDLLLQGTRDELLAARLFDVQASLYGDQRLFDLAETALDMVYASYGLSGDKHLAGRALISKGTYAGYRGDSDEAIRLLAQGAAMIDEQREPRLVYLAHHNRARLLLDSGRSREARMALWHLRSRGLDGGGRMTEWKLRWLEAQINAEMGKLDEAERGLLAVKQAFEEAELGYKAALAGLDLGAVLLRRDKLAEATREVLQAADVFQAVGVHREAAASLLLLRKAFERQKADAVLLHHVITLLRRGEDGTGGRGEGEE